MSAHVRLGLVDAYIYIYAPPDSVCPVACGNLPAWRRNEVHVLHINVILCLASVFCKEFDMKTSYPDVVHHGGSHLQKTHDTEEVALTCIRKFFDTLSMNHR